MTDRPVIQKFISSQTRDIGWAARQILDRKEVRRPHWVEGRVLGSFLSVDRPGTLISVSVLDVVATDWEIAP